MYDPKLGTSNYRKAQEGRFADHPAFIACKNLVGVDVGLRHLMSNKKKARARLAAITGQMEKGLRHLSDEAKKLRSKSDKLRFAEAIGAFFNPQKGPDYKIWRLCWRPIEEHAKNKNPSQAELRRLLEHEESIKFSDDEWKRALKRTGLSKRLPTHRQKIDQGTLRKV